MRKIRHNRHRGTLLQHAVDLNSGRRDRNCRDNGDGAFVIFAANFVVGLFAAAAALIAVVVGVIFVQIIQVIFGGILCPRNAGNALEM